MRPNDLERVWFEAACREAQKPLNANPCGALPTDVFDKAYFDRVEAERYRQQYWQKDWFNYSSFKDKKVLGIGIGLGTDLRQFAKAGSDCCGVDITDKHIELTRQNFSVNGFSVDVCKAEATALPFEYGAFCSIHSFCVLHHIPDVEKVLREAFRVLKPGVVLLTAVYHKYSVHTLAFFVRGLFNGTLMRRGVDSVLAQIESGADGVIIKPYVKLYSRSEWCRAQEAAGFRVGDADVRQISFEGKKALNVLRPLERRLGWYVFKRATAQK